MHRIEVVIDGSRYEAVAQPFDTNGNGATGHVATLTINGTNYKLVDFNGDQLPDLVHIQDAYGHRLLQRSGESTAFDVVYDSTASDDSVEESASHWFAQATTYTCAPAAITMVLADLLNMRVPEESAVWRRAYRMQAIDERGMTPRQIGEVMASFGLPTRLVKADLRSLAARVAAGHEVIMMVDASHYWPSFEEATTDADEPQLPHAVRLLSIDLDAKVAVVADTGQHDPRFSRLELPLDVLAQAWEALNRVVVIVDVTHDDVCSHLDGLGVDVAQIRSLDDLDLPYSVSGAEPDQTRPWILPITLRMRRIIDLVRAHN